MEPEQGSELETDWCRAEAPGARGGWVGVWGSQLLGEYVRMKRKENQVEALLLANEM